MTKTFPIDIFKHGIKIFFGSFEELKEELKADGFSEEIKEDMMNNTIMITLNMSTGDAVIYGKKPIKGVEGQTVLAHEIFHAVSYLLRNIGIKHSVETEEVYAYVFEDVLLKALTWLASEFHE